jgi:gliding motility-associated-like protein
MANGFARRNVIIMCSVKKKIRSSIHIITVLISMIISSGYAQPCLNGWKYRATVTIENLSGSILSDFQLSFRINTQQLIVEGKLKFDGGDIRMLSSTGSVLPHWIEPSTVNTSTTNVWVKVSSIPVGISNVYLFYGNPTAPNIANGEQTFEFFDGFDDAIINPAEWMKCGTGNFTIGGGSLRLNSVNNNDKAVLRTSRSFSGPLTAEMYVHSVSGSGSYIGLAARSIANDHKGYGLFYEAGSTNTMRLLTFHSNTIHCHTVENLMPDAKALDALQVQGVWGLTWAAHKEQYIDWPGATDHPIGRNDERQPFESDNRIVIGQSEFSGALSIDWVRARKFTKNEPLVTLGLETSLVNMALATSGGPVCEGEDLYLYANTIQGATYQWTGPNGYISNDQNPVVEESLPESSGTYTVTISVPSGCASASNSVQVTVHAMTNAGSLSGGGAVCEGSNSGALALSGNTGEPVRWESSSTGFAPWSTISITDKILDYVNVTSTLYFRVAVKNGVCPLQYTTAEEVEVAPAAKGGSILGPPPVCSGENSGTLQLSGYTGNIIQWQSSTDNWNTFTPILNTTTTHAFTNLLVTTQYRVWIESGTCPGTFSVPYIITVQPLPIVDFDAPPVCDMKAMALQNRSSIANGQIASYLWDFGDGMNSIEMNPSHLFLNQGTYPVTLRATSTYGCSQERTKDVTVNENPIANFHFNNVCIGESISFENRSSIEKGSVTYVWNFGDGSTSDLFAPRHLYQVTSQGSNRSTAIFQVVLYATSAAGCRDSLVKTAEVYAPPMAYAGSDTTMSKGYGVQLHASGGTNYVWSPAEGLSNSNVFNPMATPGETTNYTVSVTDKHGCSASDDIMVTVNNDYRVVVSNVLTPDGNGLNDTWKILNVESFSDESTVAVYDRHGKKVFSSRGYKNDWEGVYGKDILPDGPYYYVVTFDGSPIVYKGALTILRNKK